MSKHDTQAAKALSSYVNAMGHNPDAFVKELSYEHPTLQQRITVLAVRWLQHMAKTTRVDLRNQAAHETAKKMVGALDNGDLDFDLPFI
jgi:hypothetical protein